MQCKDIPERPILEFLDTLDGWGTWAPEYEHSVAWAMPENTPSKLVLAKMRQMIRKKLVKGCPCGCRGDFEITDKGRKVLEDQSDDVN